MSVNESVYLGFLVPIGDEEKFAAYVEEQLEGSEVEMLCNTQLVMRLAHAITLEEVERVVRKEWVTRRCDRVWLFREHHKSSETSVKQVLEEMQERGEFRERTMRLSCCPRKLETQIGDAMVAQALELHPTEFTHVLNVLKSNETGRIFLGLTTAEWLVGRGSSRKGRASVASYKIEEALFRYRFPIDSVVNACDVGAAPGGWTDWMLDQGFKVWAVDPAEIRAETACKAGLTHVRKKVQDAEEELLRDVPEGFQLVTCDMNVDTDILLGLLPEFLRIASDGAILVLTLKLSQLRGKQKRGKLVHNRSKAFDKVVAEQYPQLTNMGTKYLLSNRNERTVCLRFNKTKE